MIATPMDMNDVLQDVFGVPVPLIKDIPLGIRRFGGLVVLGKAINGQGQRGQLGDPVEWRNTFTNAAKTRPALLWSEIERLRKGLLRVQPDVRVVYLGSPDSELTVDTDKAYARIESIVIAETRYIRVHDGGHDMGWLASTSASTTTSSSRSSGRCSVRPEPAAPRRILPQGSMWAPALLAGLRHSVDRKRYESAR